MPPYPMFTKSKHNNLQGETFPVSEFQSLKEDFYFSIQGFDSCTKPFTHTQQVRILTFGSVQKGKGKIVVLHKYELSD